ncbi:MAG: hypothetical protein ACO242_04310 [Candidatus Fonsibacter ubiquis]
MILHFAALNDPDGNPRRVFIYVTEDGHMIAAWPEGYAGHDAVPGALREQAWRAMQRSIQITPYQYEQALTLPRPMYYNPEHFQSAACLQRHIKMGVIALAPA